MMEKIFMRSPPILINSEARLGQEITIRSVPHNQTNISALFALTSQLVRKPQTSETSSIPSYPTHKTSNRLSTSKYYFHTALHSYKPRDLEILLQFYKLYPLPDTRHSISCKFSHHPNGLMFLLPLLLEQLS